MKKAESPELKQLKAISAELRYIRRELDANIYKPFWKRAVSSFGTGVVKGVGLIIGTTVIAAIVIFLLQQLVDWAGLGDVAQQWIQSTPASIEILD